MKVGSAMMIILLNLHGHLEPRHLVVLAVFQVKEGEPAELTKDLG